MFKIPLLIAASILFSSCTLAESSRITPQKKFGNDTYYFIALKNTADGNEKEAVRNFKISREKGSELVSKRSAQSLVSSGSVKDRIKAAVYLAEHFTDDESQVSACKELFNNNEYSSVIKITDGLDLANDSNELIKLRMLSYIEKNDSRLEEDFFKWFVSRPLSSAHLEVYQEYKDFENKKFEQIQEHTKNFQKALNRKSILEHSAAPEFNSEGELISEVLEEQTDFEDFITEDSEIADPRQTIMDYRIAVYRRKYFECLNSKDKIFQIYKNFGEDIDLQLLSDIGKSALYGSIDYYASARELDRIAKTLNPAQAYYIYFYAARLYDKAGRYQAQTVSRFHSALEAADDGSKFDNALWYLLNFQLRTSTDDIIKTLKTYGSKINNPSYFDDFFESLSVLLLSAHKWQDFYEVWKQTNSNFSETTLGKYAYISGRLIEEGLAEGEAGLKTRQAVDAYTTVLAGGGSLYYKVLSLERLNLSEEEMIKSMMLSKEKLTDTDTPEEDTNPAGRLLAGYAAFGFPEKIYSEYMQNRSLLTVQDAAGSARFLNNCALLNEGNSTAKDKKVQNYNVQSLRIAARAYASAKGKIPFELLELTFPRFYQKETEEACKNNNIPEYLLYALVRSESFFNSKAGSSAGAKGLTQLMETTAADEAKKAKLTEYDIYDPETNLNFGAHYLSSLIERVPEKNELLALFAYNAGLTHVRNWISSAQKDWAQTTKSARRGPCGIPTDLFLETLPFTETREYGKKLVSAAALYGWLYEGITPAQTVRGLMY